MDGLYEGLEGMKVGGRRIISVPADLALGSSAISSSVSAQTMT